ncbi:MAG: heme-binding protein [Steroidobacteraceae bacterium]|nr:heme-binding protein [Steroidobacteraceae bacterium]MDW8260124.1 heme-binding protein [Gammaproteobacteria bacterium]
MVRRALTCSGLLGVALLLGGCGGGSAAPEVPAASTPPDVACDGSCANAGLFLSAADVERIVAQAIAEAQARGVRATIAVVDRVGNALAVFRMTGAAATMTITSGRQPPVIGGLEGVAIVPAALGAIAKAITGAYLSSEGNAFSTRTASQIVQEHFNPREIFAPSGPLFGVQFSQLPCSDILGRSSGSAVSVGPLRSPLGLAADPGGLPLYKGGTPVGGIGVIADGVYTLDLDIQDRDLDVDELVALAGSFGFAAPEDRRADRITADGKTLRFSDARFADLATNPANAPSFATLTPAQGALLAVPGYFDGAAVRAGVAFGTPASGIRADTLDYPGLDAFVLVDAANVERFRPRAGAEPVGALTAAEARALLRSSLAIANRARAQIRRPLGSPARVTISLVDSLGNVLGIVRSRDAPVFGIDVSLQKARAAAFFSGAPAAAQLTALPPAAYLAGNLTLLGRSAPGDAVVALRAFLGLPAALADGQIAFSSRALGNLARPTYPDGVDGSPAGPLSRPFAAWSPFSTGLQLDLVYNAVIRHVAFVLGAAPDVPPQCAGVSGFDAGLAATPVAAALRSGIQIFPGGIPLYRARQLVGAIGVSGDGVDQDDMIAFLGVDRAALPDIGNAPRDLRSDRLVPQGARLRYIACPPAPFLDSNEQSPCDDR